MVTKRDDAGGLLILAYLQATLAAYDQEYISVSKQASQCSQLSQLMQHVSGHMMFVVRIPVSSVPVMPLCVHRWHTG